MSDLVAETQFSDPDLAYREIVDAHRGLSDAESVDLNARLVLILANQIGDLEILRQAIALAKSATASGSPR